MTQLRRIAPTLAAIIIFLVFLYYYTIPAFRLLFEPHTSQWMIGDGTDPTPSAFLYDIAIRALEHDPISFLLGGVYTNQLNAPLGMPLFMSYFERFFAAAFGRLAGVDALLTYILLALFALNYFSVYYLGRLKKWPFWVSVTIALCFAFTPYTRARATVHPALVGAYSIPLIFCALEIIKKQALEWKDYVGASVLLLIAITATPYYVLISIFLAPLFLFFAVMGQPDSKSKWRMTQRLVIITLPAIVLLGVQKFVPIPSSLQSRAAEMPRPPEGVAEFFLNSFGSKPIDYFLSDMKVEIKDWNPLREKLTNHVKYTMTSGNYHERTNGIRWSIWGVFLVGLMGFALRRQWKTEFTFFLVFAAYCFWCSLSPADVTVFDFRLSPSLLYHQLIPEFRVTSRFGVFVAFGILMIAGQLLAHFHQKYPLLNSNKMACVLVALAIVLDYSFPTQLTVDPIAARVVPENEHCGRALYLPYVSHVPPWERMTEYYRVLQKIRGTDCELINQHGASPLNAYFNQALLSPQITEIHIRKIVACANIESIVFWERNELSEKICSLTEGKWSGLVCHPNSTITQSKPRAELPSDILTCVNAS